MGRLSARRGTGVEDPFSGLGIRQERDELGRLIFDIKPSLLKKRQILHQLILFDTNS